MARTLVTDITNNIGYIKGHRDLTVILSDLSGLDGLACGGFNDGYHVVNIYTQRGYFDSIAVNGAINDAHAVGLAQDYALSIGIDVSKAEAVGLDTLYDAQTLHKFVNDDSQNVGYKPIINEHRLSLAKEKITKTPVLWDGVTLKSHDGNVGNLLYELIRYDGKNELATPTSHEHLMDVLGELDTVAFDALVETNAKLDKLKNRLAKALQNASDNELSVTEVSQSEPFTKQGKANVYFEFGLSDGQTFRIFFHNPDSTPVKLTGSDVMTSWKWTLNSKDITAVISPAQSVSVNIGTLAQRMMLLAKKNSKRYQSAQAKKSKNEKILNDLLANIDERSTYHAQVLADIDNLREQIKQVTQAIDDKAKGAIVDTTDTNDDTPIVLTGKEFGEFDLTNQDDVAKLRNQAVSYLNSLADNSETVYCADLQADVKFGRKNNRKFGSFSGSEIKLFMAGQIKDIIAKAKTFKPSQERYDTTKQKNKMVYHYLKTAVMYQGKEYGARIVIRQDSNGNYHYDLQVNSGGVGAIFDSADIEKAELLLATNQGLFGFDNNSTNFDPPSQEYFLDSAFDTTKNPLGRDISYDWKATSNGFDGYFTDFDNKSQEYFDDETAFDSTSRSKMVLNLFIFDENGNEILDEPQDKPTNTTQYEYRPHAKDLTFVGQEFDHTPTGDTYTVWGVAKGNERWGVAILVETVNMGKKIATKELAQTVADVMADRFGATQVEIRSDRAMLQGGANAIKNAFGAGGLTQKQNANNPAGEQNANNTINADDIDTDLSSYGNDNKTAVLNFLKQMQGKHINTQIGKVLFNRISTDELSLGVKNNDIRAKLVMFVPQTLQHGKYLGKQALMKVRDDNFVAFHEFESVAQIDDNDVRHIVKVGERENGEFVFVAYHSRGAFDGIGVNKEKPVLDTVSNNKAGRSRTGFDNIVLDEADDVNDDISDDDIDNDDEISQQDNNLFGFDGLSFNHLAFDSIADGKEGWNIEIVSITPIANKAKELFGRTKPVNRHKLTGNAFVYADDRTMWSNGHILVKEQVSDELIEQAKAQKPLRFSEMPVGQLTRLIPAKAIELKLIDLATSKNAKKSQQLAIFKTPQGNEVAVQKPYLQFFIKEFGTNLEYWTDDIDWEMSMGSQRARPINLYKGGELVGLIMPMTDVQYEKQSEQEPAQKTKTAITELVNPYDENQVQEKLDKVKKQYENFGEKVGGTYGKMPANGQTVKLENARQFLLEKVLKGKEKNTIFTFTDENGKMNYKVGADTNANRKKLINAFGKIDSHNLPHERKYGMENGGKIASAEILEKIGYTIEHSEKETFYPQNALPIKNQTYEIELHGHKGAYLFVGIDNQRQLQNEADLRFLDLESDYLMKVSASRYDELMNNGKIVPINDMAQVTQLVNHNAKKEHSIYQTRANGTIIKVYSTGNRYNIEKYEGVNDKSPTRYGVDDKDEATKYLQEQKEYLSALKFVTGVENLLDRQMGQDEPAQQSEPMQENEPMQYEIKGDEVFLTKNGEIIKRLMTKQEWKDVPKDYKSVGKNGIHSVLYFGGGGTTLIPVEIISQSEFEKILNGNDETQENKPMNEPITQNQSYTQADIDYLQAIIDGTLDLETVDFDRLIAIGEKDDTDPLFEQANDVISEALDKATQGE